MQIRRFPISYFAFCLMTVLGMSSLYGQSSYRIISVSPLVGPQIDRYEFEKFEVKDQLLENLQQFNYAEIYHQEDRCYIMRVCQDDGNEVVYDVPPNIMEVYRWYIHKSGAELLSQLDRAYESLRKRERPRFRSSLRMEGLSMGY